MAAACTFWAMHSRCALLEIEPSQIKFAWVRWLSCLSAGGPKGKKASTLERQAPLLPLCHVALSIWEKGMANVRP